MDKSVDSLLKRENVAIIEKSKSWEDAITQCTNELVKQGYLTSDYPKAIVKLTKKYGPYYILSPDVALIHARPEDGVIQNQLAVTLFKKQVHFEDEKKRTARLFITLAAKDSKEHLEVLQKIGELLMDEQKMNHIMNVSDPEELYHAFKI